MPLRARKVSGAFKKRAPGVRLLCTRLAAHYSVVHSVAYCLGRGHLICLIQTPIKVSKFMYLKNIARAEAPLLLDPLLL